MLTVYPSNKMEDLVLLLKAVQHYRSDDPSELKDVLSPDIVLVESKGMQHWLNLELAKHQGIAMNYQFRMPVGFIWDIARMLLGDEVPRQSPYKREILSWRIDALMSQDSFLNNPLCKAARQYWMDENGGADPLKRYQLASRMGDVFEQYMMFRPDWLELWENNQFIANEPDIDKETEQWQALLWRELVAKEPCHPVSLQKKAIAAMADYTGNQLPRQIMIFAVNTMAPQTLAFFEALASVCNIHLFYLNPCVEFWGDIQSDKTLARQQRENKLELWLNEDETGQSRNSLLANLGQQGKDFFNLLQEVKGYEISAFDDAFDQDSSQQKKDTLLARVQRDILNLSEPEQCEMPADHGQSLVIRSSHSELREIQALHDYLLHQFNAEPDLKPRDVIVLCPAIEDYAPYIEAVFRSSYDSEQYDEHPRLPCSIADRTLMNSEPLIAAYIDLLQLPDSRFEVSKIMDYLRLPAIQIKFGFTNTELDTIEWWLNEASIHWGINSAHKEKISGLDKASATFTWQWGLERLLVGFAQSDSETLSGNRLLLPHVEGQDAVLLGRLMQLLERLQYHARELTRARTAEQWQTYLYELAEQFFSVQKEEQAAEDIIRKVINDLLENTAQASYSAPIDYIVVRNYLQQNFNQPDTGSHFLTGQITFCSMIPMRSIPFKIIAVLGLNDGKFPRQSIPVSFNLMTQGKRRKGDRSRREDDRYLFLEALISARQKLYLSYQGRDIRKNSERQPSLILKELMTYLQKFYTFEKPEEQPLHPFSKSCYLGEQASFDPRWKRLLEPLGARTNLIKLEPLELETTEISVEEMVRFFDNPLKVFCHKRLDLRFENNEQETEDTEPFSTSSLTDFKIREDFFEHLLAGDSLEVSRMRHQLSGKLPESPIMVSALDTLEQEAEMFSQALLHKGNIVSQTIAVEIADLSIQAQLHWLEETGQFIVWRPATRKAKDDIRLWLTHLLATIYTDKMIETQGIFLNYNKYKNEREVKAVMIPEHITVDTAKSELKKLLSIWQSGLCQPRLLHAVLGKNLFEKGQLKDIDPAVVVEKQISNWNREIKSDRNRITLDDDPYFKWFYPEPPQLTPEIQQHLLDSYQAVYENLQELK